MPGVQQGLTLTRGWISCSQIQSLTTPHPDSDGERQCSKTAQREMTPQLGGRERLGRRPLVLASHEAARRYDPQKWPVHVWLFSKYKSTMLGNAGFG